MVARKVRHAVESLVPQEDRTHAVIGTDDAGTIVYWNERAEELYGWSAAEAMGRNIVDVTPTMSSQAEAEEIMHRLLQGREWSGAFMVRHRDGSPMKVHVRDMPVVADDAVIGVVGVSHLLQASS